MKFLYALRNLYHSLAALPGLALDAVDRRVFEIRVHFATLDRLREGPPLNDHAVEWDRLRGLGYSGAEAQEVIRRLGDALLADAQAAVEHYRANLKENRP